MQISLTGRGWPWTFAFSWYATSWTSGRMCNLIGCNS